jgi:hypothetical protein
MTICFFKPEISVISLPVDTSLSRQGDAPVAGVCLHAQKSIRTIEKVSHENGHDAEGAQAYRMKK